MEIWQYSARVLKRNILFFICLCIHSPDVFCGEDADGDVGGTFSCICTLVARNQPTRTG
jgi:hypothetical protein